MYHQYPYKHKWLNERQTGYYQPFGHYDQYQSPNYIIPAMYQSYQNPNPNPYYPTFQQSLHPYYGNGSMNSVAFNTNAYPTPYPKPAPYIKQQPTGVQNIMSQFKNSNGQLDLNKIMDTAGQMASVVNQIGGLFKGVTSMFKS